MASQAQKAKNKAAATGVPSLPVPQIGAPTGFKVARQVTMPSLAIKRDNEQRILRFDTPMRESKVVTKAADGTAQKPATIANVTDVVTGEQFIFLVGAVVQQNLLQSYDDNGFVGKVFQITCRGKRSENQKYKDFTILELEPE